jgi:hypothetical protein
MNRATIGELLANRFPQSDTWLASGGTHQIFNYTLDDDFIFLFGEGLFIRTMVADGFPFTLSISKMTTE